MPGDRSHNPDDISDLSIEDLFAEAVAAVESISTGEIELETDLEDHGAPEEDDEIADIGLELEVELELSDGPEAALPAPEPEPDHQEEERAQRRREERRAKLKNRIEDLERKRDEARAENKSLRAEAIRLKATNQRLRERLDRLQGQNDNLEDARQNAEQQASRFRDARRRLTEDLQHLQERRRQEVAEQKRHGQAPTILAILPVLDHLQMAIDHAGAEPEKIVSGVEMVISQFNGVLRRLGVQRVEAAAGTPFQPELHEAMLHAPTDAVESGRIFQEISAGYSLNGRLLRAARVSVATALSAEPSAPAPPLSAAPEAESAQEDHPVLVEDGPLEE